MQQKIGTALPPASARAEHHSRGKNQWRAIRRERNNGGLEAESVRVYTTDQSGVTVSNVDLSTPKIL